MSKFSNTYVNVPKHIFYLVNMSILAACLTGCYGGLWTGASLVYDRHSMYKKMNDYQLFGLVNNTLFADKYFRERGSVVDLAVFNGDILLVGHMPNDELFEVLQHRLSQIKGYRRLYNEIIVSKSPGNTMQDGWITAQIRSQIVADASIDPNAFKIITADSVVYLMGDVKPDQAAKVIDISRHVQGVRKVVKILKYFTYQ